MKYRKWPFHGDSPIARARKVALAYRSHSIDLELRVQTLTDIISKVDPRLVDWIDDPAFKQVWQNIQDSPGDTESVADLDRRFSEWGENWHAEVTRTFELDEWITAEEAAVILCVGAKTVTMMRARGRIDGKYVYEAGNAGPGRWYFKVADVYALSQDRRTRGSRTPEATDTVASSRSGDAE